MTVDTRPAKPIRANAVQWKRIRAIKLDGKPCRCGCGLPAESLHHLVGRDLRGDDCIQNLVPLAGDGTRLCHGEVQRLERQRCSQLRANLSASEIAYVIEKKSEAFLDRYYPVSA